MKKQKFIEETNYVKFGDMLVLRSGLSRNHPESWESLWKKKYGSLDEFPYYEIYGIEPSFRMTRDSLKNFLEIHDENPNMSVEGILERMDVDGDFSEYGA